MSGQTPSFNHASAQPLLGRGRLWHARLAPVVHRFQYASYFVMLPMRKAPMSRRWGPLSFDTRDHGLGQGDPVQWMDALLQEGGVVDADGPLWLQTYPRVLGYAFKPVSFWMACDKTGAVKAVVAEVNNTFGERHCYLIKAPNMDGQRPAWADKVFHVSPFCSVEGQYAFRFDWQPGRQNLQIEVDLHQQGQVILKTGLRGHLAPLQARSAWRAFWAVPLMTLNVVLRIHWQALRLAVKRVPFFRKPQPPTRTVT